MHFARTLTLHALRTHTGSARVQTALQVNSTQYWNEAWKKSYNNIILATRDKRQKMIQNSYFDMVTIIFTEFIKEFLTFYDINFIEYDIRIRYSNVQESLPLNLIKSSFFLHSIIENHYLIQVWLNTCLIECMFDSI